MDYFYFALLIVCAFAANWFRCWSRFWYGCLEIVAAIGLMIIAVFHPEPGHLLLTNGSLFGSFLSDSLSYVASVYLMVRGLDNIGGDLPERWRAGWSRIFPRLHSVAKWLSALNRLTQPLHGEFDIDDCRLRQLSTSVLYRSLR
jgi:hypothetical protein